MQLTKGKLNFFIPTCFDEKRALIIFLSYKEWWSCVFIHGKYTWCVGQISQCNKFGGSNGFTISGLISQGLLPSSKAMRIKFHIVKLYFTFTSFYRIHSKLSISSFNHCKVGWCSITSNDKFFKVILMKQSLFKKQEYTNLLLKPFAHKKYRPIMSKSPLNILHIKKYITYGYLLVRSLHRNCNM